MNKTDPIEEIARAIADRVLEDRLWSEERNSQKDRDSRNELRVTARVAMVAYHKWLVRQGLLMSSIGQMRQL